MQATWTQINWDNKTKIDLSRPQEVTFWAKKWEISSSQLYKAFILTGSNRRKKIEQYLRDNRLIE